jgi:putative acetyltransferase
MATGQAEAKGVSESEENFLQRWSRRKTAVRADPKAATLGAEGDADAGEVETASLDTTGVAPPQVGDKTAPRAPADATAKPIDKPLTEEDFADVDFGKLDYGSDYGRFMQKGVPESIRQKALGQLWQSDTIFTQIDPFQDYAGDYTDAAVAVPGGMIKTAYKIGQGFLSDEEAAEWDKLGKPEVGAPPPIVAADVRIARENPDQPDIRAFLAASDAYMATLYPAESNHLVDVATLQQDTVHFYVARHGALAIGCGAIVMADDHSAEIKRMWIDPKARGLKLGAALLAKLETAAREAGCTIMRLETGISQPEALALYRKAGFTEIAPFGSYKPDPLSLFMEKAVAA